MTYKKYLLLIKILILLGLLSCESKNNKIKIDLFEIKINQNILGLQDSETKNKLNNLTHKFLQKNSYFMLDEKKSETNKLLIYLDLDNNTNNNNIIIKAEVMNKNSKNKLTSQSKFNIGSSGFLVKNYLDALKEVSAQIQIQYTNNKSRNENPDLIIKDLLDGKPVSKEETQNAITKLGNGGDQECLLLIKFLKFTKDIALANSTLFALVPCKSEVATQAIIDFAEHKPAIIRRQAIMAVRGLSTYLGAAWLSVLAYGHENLMVRSEAYEALEYIESRLEI